MGKNKNLHQAKRQKNDEFYTSHQTVSDELQHYWSQLEGKKLYCPCDDYRWSAFVKYFRDNFEKIGLQSLTATNYDIGDGAWKYVYDGQKETVTKLEGDGDFRSQEITTIKNESDVVITNPPFSLWREFFRWLND